jgi:hypothetical protein
MPLASCSKLGPYEILSSLGAGGMGEVYRARDTRLERTVAIKILPQQLSNDPVRKQRFERDVGSQAGMDYLVMECLEGESLAKRLEKGPMPLEQVLKFGGQIADALDRAHRSGVVHLVIGSLLTVRAHRRKDVYFSGFLKNLRVPLTRRRAHGTIYWIAGRGDHAGSGLSVFHES